jgi:hypothetical protein
VKKNIQLLFCFQQQRIQIEDLNLQMREIENGFQIVNILRFDILLSQCFLFQERQQLERERDV